MTQRYAQLHDSTIRQHFEDATSHIEGILITDWLHLSDDYVNADAEH